MFIIDMFIPSCIIPDRKNGSVAQLAEQLTLNQLVEGSSPPGVTHDNESPLTGALLVNSR